MDVVEAFVGTLHQLLDVLSAVAVVVSKKPDCDRELAEPPTFKSCVNGASQSINDCSGLLGQSRCLTLHNLARRCGEWEVKGVEKQVVSQAFRAPSLVRHF